MDAGLMIHIADWMKRIDQMRIGEKEADETTRTE